MLLYALLTACSPGVEGVTAACDRDATDLELDATTDLGFSAAEVLAWLEAAHTSSLVLADESTGRDLTVTVTATGAARWVDQSEAESSDTGAQPAIAAVCDDFVELDAVVEFATADGAFAESWEVTLPVEQVAGTQVTVPFENDAFAGSYSVPQAMIDACDSSHVQVDLYFSEGGGTSGSIWLACEVATEDTVSEGLEPLASWGEGEQM